MEALANDEPLHPFYKYLMFTHLYTPEQVKEIGHEEINRMEKKCEEELPKEIYHEDDGTNGEDYEITGFGWDEQGNRSLYLEKIVFEDGEEDEDYVFLDIPIPITKTDEWYDNLKSINN